MKEKASHKENGEDRIPRIDPDAPGIPAGEELALDPVGGDEIDPIDRWWDDLKVPDRGKITNRRLEQLDEGAPPRRKLQKPELAAEFGESQGVSGRIESSPPSDADGAKLLEASEEQETAKQAEKRKADREPKAGETAELDSVESDQPVNTSEEKAAPEETEKPPMAAIPETSDKSDERDGAEDANKTSIPDVPGPAAEKVIHSVAASQTGKKTGCWTVFATLFFFATILLLGGVAIAAAFAWSQIGALEEKITALANEKLEEKGIFLDYGDWTYQFPRGLVFDEVTIFDDATRQRPLLKASSLGVNVDVLGLVNDPGQVSSVEVSLENSQLILFEAGELVAEISGIDGEILASAEQIRVERLSADIGGLSVKTGGLITLPKVETVADATGAENIKPAPISLDYTVFRQLEPWLTMTSAAGNKPVLSFTFAMDADKPDEAVLGGSLYGREVSWRGIAFSSLSASFNLVPETGELSFPSFQAGFGTGFIGGKMAIDKNAKILKIEQLQSTVDVIALLSAYDSDLKEKLKLIRFVDAPTMQVSGQVPLEDPAQADLKVKYEHREGLVYLMGERELPLRDLRGNFTVNRGSIETNDTALELFGGAVVINGATRLTDESRPFNGLIEITRMPLDKASVFFGQEKVGMSGFLSLAFRGAGNKDVAKIRGGGTLRIDEASLPSFPVLGPVQALVGQVIPAFDAKEKGSVIGAYIIESGVLLTSDLTVANGGAKVITSGSVNLSSQDTKFTAKAVLEPALAAATGLTDKAITVEGSGPLTSPVLKITNFPLEFASASLGQVLGTTPESLGSLKEILGTDADAVGVVSGKLEEATGIKIDPAVTDLFKSLLGGGKKPETPLLRAQPQ